MYVHTTTHFYLSLKPWKTSMYYYCIGRNSEFIVSFQSRSFPADALKTSYISVQYNPPAGGGPWWSSHKMLNLHTMRASSALKGLLYLIVATVLGLVVFAKSSSAVPKKTSSKRVNASSKHSSAPVATPQCTPSAVVNAYLRNGAFDNIPINPGASTTHEPPWYFDRLSNSFGRFTHEPSSAYSGGGAA